MQDIQLIAFDLDGTAINSGMVLTHRTLGAVQEALSRGVKIVPVTGRQLGNIPDDILDMPGIEYVISDNGAQICTLPDRQRIFSKPFEKKQAQQLLLECRNYHSMLYVSIGPEGMIDCPGKDMENSGIVEPDEPSDEYWGNRSVDAVRYIERPGIEMYKLVITFPDDEAMQEVFHIFEDRNDLVATSSMSNNIELIPTGVSKEEGLRFVAGMLQVAMQNVMAVGDHHNDIGMITAAGWGVAMGNALDAVKAVADSVTLSNDEDGLAVAIERILQEKALAP